MTTGPATGPRPYPRGQSNSARSRSVNTPIGSCQHALTLIAALVHAGTPLTPEHLAVALDRPLDQVTSALHDADRHPDLADPVAVRGNKSGAFYVAARPDRLTTAQRRRLARNAS